MTAHISDELPRMLTGEASRDTVLDAAAHLRTCVDCQQDLVSAVVAHASLTSAQRFAPELVSGLPFDLLTARGEGEDEDESTAGTGERPERTLPDLSSLFAKVREEAAEPKHRARAPRRRVLVSAAAAVVVLGGGGAIYALTSGNDSASTDTGRTVRLAAFDKGSTPAEATIAPNGNLRIDAASLPHVTGKRYEVWLTNSGRTKMQPVGWLQANGTAAMTVPSDLLSRFSDIEVSVQNVNASSYDYSGTSVLRGGYA